MKLRKGNGGSKSRMETSPLIVLHVATSLARGHQRREWKSRFEIEEEEVFRGRSKSFTSFQEIEMVNANTVADWSTSSSSCAEASADATSLARGKRTYHLCQTTQ